MLTSEGEALEHAPTIERTESGITFWPDGAMYSAKLDGKPYLV